MRRYIILYFAKIKRWCSLTMIRRPKVRSTISTFLLYAAAGVLFLVPFSSLLTYYAWHHYERGQTSYTTVRELLQAEQNKELPQIADVGQPVPALQDMPYSPQDQSEKPVTLMENDETMIKPLSGTILAPYGWREDSNYKDWRFHSGINIRPAKSSKVQAAKSGQVEKLSRNDCGISIKLVHSKGVVTIYEHIGDTSLHVGQFVEQGQNIGSLGVVGETYLHFEIWQDNRSIDPSGLFQD